MLCRPTRRAANGHGRSAAQTRAPRRGRASCHQVHCKRAKPSLETEDLIVAASVQETKSLEGMQVKSGTVQAAPLEADENTWTNAAKWEWQDSRAATWRSHRSGKPAAKRSSFMLVLPFSKSAFRKWFGRTQPLSLITRVVMSLYRSSWPSDLADCGVRQQLGAVAGGATIFSAHMRQC